MTFYTYLQPTPQPSTQQGSGAQIPSRPSSKSLHDTAKIRAPKWGWVITKTAVAFEAEFKELTKRKVPILDLNVLYWRDAFASIEAHGIMAVWRMLDISQAAFRAMEEHNYVPSSILARSAFESAIQFVHDARLFAANIDKLAGLDMDNNLVTNSDLENIILQTVYASRLPSADDLYKSKNILTTLEKIAKIAKNDPIKEQYDILCEMTHPNFLGRSNYLVDMKKGKRDGDEVRLISHANGKNSESILSSTLWALSWSLARLIHPTDAHC